MACLGSANVQIVFYDGDAPSLDAVEVEDMLLGAARTEETKKKDPTQHRCPFSTKLIPVFFSMNTCVDYFILCVQSACMFLTLRTWSDLSVRTKFLRLLFVWQK